MTVVMYVKPGCLYCRVAREHFDQAGPVVEERYATENATWKGELTSYTDGSGVVPTIVREGETVQVGFPPGRGLPRPLTGRSAAAAHRFSDNGTGATSAGHSFAAAERPPGEAFVKLLRKSAPIGLSAKGLPHRGCAGATPFPRARSEQPRTSAGRPTPCRRARRLPA